MELQAITGQLYILDGEPQAVESVPGLLALRAPSRAPRGRQRDHLFVHLTLSGPPAETENLAQDLVDAIVARFYQAGGSITSALRQALIQANRLLFDRNMQEASPYVGAICLAAYRDQDLYLVQTGEALAYVGRPFGVERLPAARPDHITPLGRTAGIDIRFFHNVLTPGDTLLLADPRLGHLDSRTLSPAITDIDVESGLAALTELIGPGTARLLFVEFTDELLDDVPEFGSRPRLVVPPGPRDVLAPPERPPQRGTPRVPPSAPRRSVDVERQARRATAQTARGISRATDGLADVLDRIRPPEPAQPPAGGWALPAILAIVIPLLVAVIITGVFLQRDVVRNVAGIELAMNDALRLAEQAEADGRLPEAREGYARVITLADDAEVSLGPNTDAMLSLRSRAGGALDRLDNVSRLDAVPFFQFDSPAVITALALRDGDEGGLYALDGAGNRAYAFETDPSYENLLDSDPQLLFSTGDNVGGHVVGIMVDLLWRPAGRTIPDGALTILDSRGALLAWEPQTSSRSHLPFDLASEWRGINAITTYNERIYLLDPGAETIWRYFPEVTSYQMQADARTVDLTDEPDLAQAVDFDINQEDAKIIVAYSNGDLRYFDSNSGRQLWGTQELLANGLPAPLTAPVAVRIVGRGVGSSIFVADAGSGRVLQISQSGAVLAQYKARDDNGRELFAGMGDFAILQTPLRIFVAVEDTIYLARP